KRKERGCLCGKSKQTVSAYSSNQRSRNAIVSQGAVLCSAVSLSLADFLNTTEDTKQPKPQPLSRGLPEGFKGGGDVFPDDFPHGVNFRLDRIPLGVHPPKLQFQSLVNGLERRNS